MASAPTLGNRFVELHTAQYSASTYLTVQSLNLRNGRAEMNVVENHGRKVVFGVLCPAALVLVSVIETLGRVIFSAGAYGYMMYHGGENAEGLQAERHHYLSNVGFSGTFYTAENVANCVMAIIANFKNWNAEGALNYDGLLPGLAAFNEPSLKNIDFQLSTEPVVSTEPVDEAEGDEGDAADNASSVVEKPKMATAPDSPKEAPKQEASA